MNKEKILEVSSRLAPQIGRCKILLQDVTDGRLTLSIQQGTRGKNNFLIFRDNVLLFTGKVETVMTFVKEKRVKFTLFGKELSNYEVYVSANIPNHKKISFL